MRIFQNNYGNWIFWILTAASCAYPSCVLKCPMRMDVLWLTSLVCFFPWIHFLSRILKHTKRIDQESAIKKNSALAGMTLVVISILVQVLLLLIIIMVYRTLGPIFDKYSIWIPIVAMCSPCPFALLGCSFLTSSLIQQTLKVQLGVTVLLAIGICFPSLASVSLWYRDSTYGVQSLYWYSAGMFLGYVIFAETLSRMEKMIVEKD